MRPDPAQLTLLPQERPRGVLMMVAADQVNAGRTPAEQDLVASVAQLGVLESLALVATGGRYDIADGERRHSAAVQAGVEQLPALVFPEGTPPWIAAAITLACNMHRGPNHLRELEAVEAAMARVGGDPLALARELRLKPGTVKKRLRLNGLIPGLREAFANGRVTAKAAYRACALDQAAQQRLLRTLGTLKAEPLNSGHVRAERAARRELASAAVLDVLAQVDAPAPDPDALAAAEAGARGALDRLRVFLVEHYGDAPAGPAELVDRVQYLLRHHGHAPETPAIARVVAHLDAAEAAALEGGSEALHSLAARVGPVAENARQVLQVLREGTPAARRARRGDDGPAAAAAPPIALHQTGGGA